VTLEEEKQLVSYYAQKLIELAKTMKLPDKVVSSACTYLQRFYIRNSCLEYDPQGIVLTCLYIAAKVEDWYISAEHIHTVGGIPEDVILKSELPLLQGLGFDLQVHPIHKALDGFLAMREEDATLRDKAAKIVEGFLLTDAIMLFTPGQLALKAIGSTLPDIDDASMKDERLVEILLQIDKYVDTKRMEDVKMIDRKLKLFLKGQKKRKRKQEEI
jgi:cyclin H